MENLILGITSLWGGDPSFEEIDVHIESGEQIISSDIHWNAATVFSSDKKTALPEISYQKDGEWRLWPTAATGEETENTGHIHDDFQLDLLISGSLKKELLIKSEGPADITIHFFNTKKDLENLQAFDPFDDDSKDDPITGLARKVKPPKFITRSMWGADESLREWQVLRKLKHLFRSAVPEAKWASKKMQPLLVTRYAENGEKLLWPVEKSPMIKKFVIHHTGEFVDETRNPYEIMRAVYSYHTKTRGWGDIGYNYVIDKQGNIYEGRYGGPTMVGAHTAYHNLGSIGISLMGNFQYEYPTNRQTQVLTLLLAEHSNRFKINPLGESYFLEKQSKNITTHRDVARKGRGTACPGKNLHKKLPSIRKEAARLAMVLKKQDRHNATSGLWKKSKAEPIFKAFWLEKKAKEKQNYKKSEKKRVIAENSVMALDGLLTQKILSVNTRTHLKINIKNNSKKIWKKGTKITVSQVPEGMTVAPFFLQKETEQGNTGRFLARVNVKSTPTGVYTLHLVPQLKLSVPVPEFDYPIRITPDIQALLRSKTALNKLTRGLQTSVIRKKDTPMIYGEDVKIKLAFFKERYALIESNDEIIIYSYKDEEVGRIPAKTAIRIIPSNNPKDPFTLSYREDNQSKKILVNNPKFKTIHHFSIHNYRRGLKGSLAYNKFRSQLNFVTRGAKNFIIVNQLPIELYLQGLAEEPSTEPTEKKHAIHILARSYAHVYSGKRRKFGTPLFDLEDDPKSSQFYLGYEWEKYHPEQKDLLQETKGMVITHKGRPVIGPYFTQSAGESSDRWQKQYPWTQKQKLPYDEGLEQRGHGIGLSGNTARKLAEKGWNYEKILKYFFRWIKVEKAY